MLLVLVSLLLALAVDAAKPTPRPTFGLPLEGADAEEILCTAEFLSFTPAPIAD